MENHDILSDSLKICTVQSWETSWHLQLTEENFEYVSAHFIFFWFCMVSSVAIFLFSLVVEHLHWQVAATIRTESNRESRWRGELGVRDFPSSVKKLPRMEYQCTSSSFLLSSFYFLSLPLQQSPVTPLVISLFLHCPPSIRTFLTPIPACHLSSSSSLSSRPSVVVSLLSKFTPHRFPLVRILPCSPSGVLP